MAWRLRTALPSVGGLLPRPQMRLHAPTRPCQSLCQPAPWRALAGAGGGISLIGVGRIYDTANVVFIGYRLGGYALLRGLPCPRSPARRRIGVGLRSPLAAPLSAVAVLAPWAVLRFTRRHRLWL